MSASLLPAEVPTASLVDRRDDPPISTDADRTETVASRVPAPWNPSSRGHLAMHDAPTMIPEQGAELRVIPACDCVAGVTADVRWYSEGKLVTSEHLELDVGQGGIATAPLKVPAGADEADYDLTVSWEDGTATRLPSAEGSYRTAVRSAPGIVARADDATDRSLPTGPVAGSFPISADFDASVPAVVIPVQAEGDSLSSGGFCASGPGEAVFADMASGRLLVHGGSGVSVVLLPDAVRGAADFVVDPALSTGYALYDDRVEEYAIHDDRMEIRATVGLASPLVPGSAAVVAGSLVARTSPTTIERILGSGGQAPLGDLAAIDAISGAPVVVRFHDGASPRIYHLDEVLRDVGGGSVFQGGAARIRPDGQIETLLSFAEADRVVWAYAAIRDDGQVTRLVWLGAVWAPVSGDPFRVCDDRLAMARVSDDGTRVDVVDLAEVG